MNLPACAPYGSDQRAQNVWIPHNNSVFWSMLLWPCAMECNSFAWPRWGFASKIPLFTLSLKLPQAEKKTATGNKTGVFILRSLATTRRLNVSVGYSSDFFWVLKLQAILWFKTTFIANVLISFQLCPAAVCVYFGAVYDVVCCSMYVPCL